MSEDRRALICFHGCTLPDNEQLYPIGTDLVHAIYTRGARLYGYNGPEPAESEPCGPVTRAISAPHTDIPTCPRCGASTLESGKRCAWCEEPLT